MWRSSGEYGIRVNASDTFASMRKGEQLHSSSDWKQPSTLPKDLHGSGWRHHMQTISLNARARRQRHSKRTLQQLNTPPPHQHPPEAEGGSEQELAVAASPCVPTQQHHQRHHMFSHVLQSRGLVQLLLEGLDRWVTSASSQDPSRPVTKKERFAQKMLAVKKVETDLDWLKGHHFLHEPVVFTPQNNGFPVNLPAFPKVLEGARLIHDSRKDGFWFKEGLPSWCGETQLVGSRQQE